jgi:hypothetical protein
LNPGHLGLGGELEKGGRSLLKMTEAANPDSFIVTDETVASLASSSEVIREATRKRQS